MGSPERVQKIVEKLLPWPIADDPIWAGADRHFLSRVLEYCETTEDQDPTVNQFAGAFESIVSKAKGGPAAAIELRIALLASLMSAFYVYRSEGAGNREGTAFGVSAYKRRKLHRDIRQVAAAIREVNKAVFGSPTKALLPAATTSLSEEDREAVDLAFEFNVLPERLEQYADRLPPLPKSRIKLATDQEAHLARMVRMATGAPRIPQIAHLLSAAYGLAMAGAARPRKRSFEPKDVADRVEEFHRRSAAPRRPDFATVLSSISEYASRPGKTEEKISKSSGRSTSPGAR